MKNLTVILNLMMIPIVGIGQKDINGINVSEYIELGGVKQWIMGRGADSLNPVLLFLHGGPGFPESPFAYYDSKELEEQFIVVNWDQRGCGKSVGTDIPLQTINIDQILADTKDLIEYLKVKYNKKKIYLLGHSWGSILGLKIIDKYPDDFYAYIGMGQVISMLEGEIASYNYALNRATEINDTNSVNQLLSLGPPPYDNYEQIMTQRAILSKFGGAFKNISFMDLFNIMQQSPDYNGEDKGGFMASFIKTQNLLWPQMMNIDFSNSILEYDIPVYFFLGKYDYGCPFELVEDYFNRIIAPYKEIIWFYNSGHWPNIEEPEKFQDVLVNKVLNNNLLK